MTDNSNESIMPIMPIMPIKQTITNSKWSEWNTKVINQTPRVGNPPPMPYLSEVVNNNPMYSFAIDNGQSPDVRGIISQREPYAQEELMTKYGNLDSRVGTDLGR